MKLTFCVTPNEQDWIAIHKCTYKLKYSQYFLWMLGLVVKLIALTCLYWLLEYGPSMLAAWGFIVSTTFVLVLAFTPILVKERAKTQYRTSKALPVQSTVELNEQGISLVNSGVSVSLNWQHVGAVADTPDGLLVCVDPSHPFWWLPNRVFTDEQSREVVLRLLERMNVKIKQVR